MTELYCSYCKLTELPNSIENLQELKILSCFGNRISTISTGVCNLYQLQHLNMSNNMITKLPKEICNLTNIITCDFHNNKIYELPEEIGNMKMLRLLMCYTYLTKLPSSFSLLSNLQNISQFDKVSNFSQILSSWVVNTRIYYQERDKYRSNFIYICFHLYIINDFFY